VADLPLREHPTERLYQLGPSALATREVLAALIGGSHQLQVADELLVRFQSLHNLARASADELADVPHLGRAGAARLQAALELGRRSLAEQDDRPQVRSPADAANLVMCDMQLLEQEELRLVLLDTKNRVIAIPTLYRGNVNTSVIRLAEVFREALRYNAVGLIVVHNHPSGDPTPSPEDIRVTERMVEAARLMDIDLLDHVVIGHNRFVSLKERRLGFG
jgi:DNA repair protein RadC